MKKYFYSLFAAASMMLAVTSCSQEEELEQISSGQTTTFNVNLDGVVGSRAGEGTLATELHYEVHRIMPDGSITKVADYEPVDLTTTKNVPITLLNGEKYNIIFWAQAPVRSGESPIYNVDDLQNITVNYNNNTELLANQEKYDAFYNALAGFKADGKTHTVTLRRPFAQLNLGANDWETAKTALDNQDPVTTTSVKVKRLASTFNALTGKADGEINEAITFALNTIPEGYFKVSSAVNATDYKYLSANYLLISGEKTPNGLGEYKAETECKATVDLEFVLKRGDNEILKLDVPNAPVQRNWRTNVIGALLTGGNSFDIVIDSTTDNDENINTPVVGLSALNEALKAYEEEAPVIYNVTGLGTVSAANIVIPEGFKSTKVTFNFKDIKENATLSIQDEDANTYKYSGTLAVNLGGQSLSETTIVLPGGHVELYNGNYGNGSVTTSPTTLVLYEGANIGALTVNGGNVEIQSGSVDTIEAGENNDDPIIVTLGNNVALPVIKEGTEVIIQGTDDAENVGVVYVAQVGDYKYTNLKDAVALITPKEGEEIAVGEIKMINDYSLDGTVTIPAGKVITLDLNGKTISQEKECTASYEMICNKGTLTIKDSSENGNGKISFKDTSAGDSTYGWGSYTVRNEGTLVVEGGIIEHLGEQEAHMICAIFQYSGSSTINGGTISTPKYRSARLWSGDMTINGGIFDGQLWLQAVNNTADLTINGGSFKPNGKDGSSVFVTNAQYDVKFAVTGGTFETKIGCSDATKLAGCITGGTFTTEAKDNTNSGLFNADCKFVESNGYWTLEAKEPVAKIGDTEYTTLQKAVNEVQDGGTITLIANETFSVINRYNNGGWWDGLGYSGDKSFTIDLGGNTISQDGALNDYLMWFKNDGSKGNTITLKNGTLDAGTTAYCAFATASSNAQKITINTENITFVNNNSNGAVLKIRGGSELNVKAGTIIEGINSYVGIEAVGNNTVVNIYDGAKIYQKGTSSYVGAIVGASYNATMNIYGGYGKSAKCGIIVMSTGATINVSGGEWIANNDGPVAGGNQGVLVSQNNRYESGWACKSVMNVTGGTFKGGYDCWGNGPGVEADDAQINIKGGNFNADPTQYVVTGYEVTGNSGNYTVGKPKALVDLEAAIANGGNVTLTGDVTLLESLKIEKGNVILDLNGKTITAPLFSAFEVKGGQLTLKNGKVVAYESTVRAIGGKAVIESGEYTSTGTALDSPATYRYSLDCREGGELIVNGGTFKSNNGMINVGSAVTINGGKFENIVEKSMTRHFAYVSGKITINDGEFYGKANSSAGGCFFCGAAAGCDIQIKGGKFTSLWTSGSVNKIFEVYYDGTINVTGGLFNTNGGIASFVTENTDEATKAAYPYVAIK